MAVTGLLEGLESESLVILAGMSESDNKFQLTEYFENAINELKIELPDKRTAAIELSLFYAQEIIDNRLDPIDGLSKIIRNCLNSYNFFDESNPYAMDSIQFHILYGLYWTYDDLKNSDNQWQKDKSNEELMQETKSEIIKETRIWIRKIK